MTHTQSVEKPHINRYRLGLYEEVIGTFRGRSVHDGEDCLELDVNERRLSIPLLEDEWSRAERVLSNASIGQRVGLIHIPEARPDVRVRVIESSKKKKTKKVRCER